MREIIFRGKRIDNNEWIYGLITTQIEKGITEKKLLSAITSNSFGVGEHQVDTETIGQYTGLTDKKGKKIFEGDIIKARHNEYLYIVKYEDCGFVIEDKWGSRIKQHQDSVNRLECEIVGNIWDNPEIIKGEK